jgi:hypothetical protein
MRPKHEHGHDHFGKDTAAVVFDNFDLSGYDLFLRAKKLPESQLEYHHERDHYVLRTPARYAAMLGATDPAAERESAAARKLPLRLSALHRGAGAGFEALRHLRRLRPR